MPSYTKALLLALSHLQMDDIITHKENSRGIKQTSTKTKEKVRLSSRIIKKSVNLPGFLSLPLKLGLKIGAVHIKYDDLR